MFHDILFLIMGLTLIVLGGNYVTDGAVAIANRFKISPIVVGITVVAFGSSTPDLVVSVMSTIQNKSELAIGDVVGAGMFDSLLVIGITAMISPIKISQSAKWIDMPVMALAAILLFVLTQDKWLDDGRTDMLSRVDGIVLLVIFALFMIYTLKNAHNEGSAPQPAASSAKTSTQQPAKKPMALWLAIVCVVGGLGVLIIGGNWIVDGASGIALKAGLSEGLVGLTVVAIGSSVPDMATSVAAAIKKEPGLAMGNIFGSCIMDMLFVLGTCAVIKPLHTGNITFVNFASLAVASLILLCVAWFYKKEKITRVFGVILAGLYVAYMAYLVISHP